MAQTLGWERARELGELLGDWVTTDLEKELDTQWRQRLAEVAAFVAGQGRLPRHRPATTQAEGSLSIWLQTQNNHALHARLNWLLLPVQDKRWDQHGGDKGGFIQAVIGWKPSAFNAAYTCRPCSKRSDGPYRGTRNPGHDDPPAVWPIRDRGSILPLCDEGAISWRTDAGCVGPFR